MAIFNVAKMNDVLDLPWHGISMRTPTGAQTRAPPSIGDFLIPLPDAGESISALFICFCELPGVVPTALETNAPGVEPVNSLLWRNAGNVAYRLDNRPGRAC
jgi:hypothetical protein